MANETEELFAGQFRLTGEPYHEHCFRVAIIARERANVTDPNTIAACAGHDNREFAVEQAIKGIHNPLFERWTAQSGYVEEKYGYAVERLIAAVTVPYVGNGRSNEESNRILFERIHCLFDRREFAEVKTPDRVDNMRTLTPAMGLPRLINKVQETRLWYLPWAEHHNILVPELRQGIAMGEALIESLHQVA
jgi:(p)ppGpp synthase/HD superfamily hydrolase